MKSKSHATAAAITVTALSLTTLAHSAIRYWDGGTANWSGGSSGLTGWSTASNATTPNPTTTPGASDDLIFNIIGNNSSNIISHANGNRAAKSLTFNTGGSSNFRAGGASTASSTLTIGAGGITMNSGAGAVTIGQTPTSYGTITVTLGANQTWTNDSTATLTVTGPLTGSGNLNKQGTGKLTLTGASSAYTGGTTISSGTLALGSSGSINNTSGVTLAGGTFDVSAKTGGYTVANLGGSGTVLGALTVSTELAIGTSPGTISFEDLTLAGAATYTYDLTGGGSTADLGNVSGTLDLGSATLDLVQLGTYTLGDRFTLFAYDTLSGTFNGLADGDTFNDAGGQWQIDYDDTTAGLNGGTGTSFVTITAVPEPHAALLGGLGLLALLRRRRF